MEQDYRRIYLEHVVLSTNQTGVAFMMHGVLPGDSTQAEPSTSQYFH